MNLACGIVAFLVVLPAFILPWAPDCYSSFRLPGIWCQLKNLHRRRVLTLVGLAGCARAVSSIQATALFVWQPRSWSWNPYLAEPIIRWSPMLFLAVLPALLVALIIRVKPGIGSFVVKGYAFYTLPGLFLQASASLLISAYRPIGPAAATLSVLSIIPDVLIVTAGSIAVLATVGSRWRFVAYTCFFGVAAELAQAMAYASLGLLFERSSGLHSQYQPSSQEELLIMLSVAIPAGIDIVARLCAAHFFDREATGILATKMQQELQRSQKGLKAPTRTIDIMVGQSSLDHQARGVEMLSSYRATSSS
jgi:hypothetical protein